MMVGDIIMCGVAVIIVGFVAYFIIVNPLIEDHKWNKFLKAESENKDIQRINSMLEQLNPVWQFLTHPEIEKSLAAP